MRSIAAALFWGTVALALHVGVLWVAPPGGGGAGGTGGEAAQGLAAAGPDMAALAQSWDAAPAVAARPGAEGVPSAAPVPDAPAPVATTVPARPAVPGPPGDPAAPQAAPSPPLPDAPPAPEAPPPEAAPVATAPRPPARPAARRPAPAPVVASRAAGAGSALSAGAAGRDAPGLSPEARQTLLARWGAAIRARIDRAARQAAPPGAAGTAHVTLIVARGGALEAARLARSSGDPGVDRAALEAVRRAGAFPPAPAGFDAPQQLFTLPIGFRR
jgi:periplasmic protein TonB